MSTLVRLASAPMSTLARLALALAFNVRIAVFVQTSFGLHFATSVCVYGAVSVFAILY